MDNITSDAGADVNGRNPLAALGRVSIGNTAAASISDGSIGCNGCMTISTKSRVLDLAVHFAVHAEEAVLLGLTIPVTDSAPLLAGS
jgi:hypothetical protein